MLRLSMIVFAVFLTAMPFAHAGDDKEDTSNPAPVAIPPGAWHGKRAMEDIAHQLSFGSRALDTPGHELAVRFIQKELQKAKAAVVKGQQWMENGTRGGGTILGWMRREPPGKPHAMVNIVGRYYPDNPRRIIVGTHYDSIIRAYRDKDNPDAVMPGANNSASGVALLLETARALGRLPLPPVGIDFVFFDGEEGTHAMGAGDPYWRPLGSPYFAQNLDDFYPDEKPEVAVIFDMVCDRELDLHPEPNSLRAASGDVENFWGLGRRHAPQAFKAQPFPEAINDDHDALIAAGIPSFLVIDFKYEPWFNTTQDTADKCSAASLEAVGRTLLDYIYSL